MSTSCSVRVYEFEVITVMPMLLFLREGRYADELPLVTVGEKVVEFINLRF